ncbi:hypothetical protein [Amycolatopsis sp. NPDC004079]|uniref:hypothetical protein n=1 Tax=Amycolatopsis sp. NPDC004079 TaxID=3154549 RepID=UPI0033B8E833
MPKFHSDARPVLGYLENPALARASAWLVGRHISVVRHRPDSTALRVPARKRFYLIDRRPQIVRTAAALPSPRSESWRLTVTAEWWIHDPYLLLATAPSDAPLHVRHDVGRTVNILARASSSQELLAVRRFVEEQLHGSTVSTTAGFAWRLTTVRADALPVESHWRDEVDAWLHYQLADSDFDGPSAASS